MLIEVAKTDGYKLIASKNRVTSTNDLFQIVLTQELINEDSSSEVVSKHQYFMTEQELKNFIDVLCTKC